MTRDRHVARHGTGRRAVFLERPAELRTSGRPVVVTDPPGGGALAAACQIDSAREMLGGERVRYTVRYIDIHAERVRRHIRGQPMPGGHGQREGTFAEYPHQAASDGRYIIAG